MLKHELPCVMLKHDLRRLTVALWCLCMTMPGAGGASRKSESPVEQNVVIATVGGEAIYAGDAQRLLGKVIAGQGEDPAAWPILQAQALSEIIDRRLVLAYARRTKSGPTDAEVDAALAEFKATIQAQRRSLNEYLKEQSITEADLRRQITWNLAWEKYLARYVTDERLASYFEAHPREFDGTEISVSHILLRPAADDGPRAMDEAVKQAQGIREQITSGATSFAEAAAKYSAGPSGKEGGRLGFIGRRGPMAEPFSRAAFALEVGQVSEPVTTRFGVHLIRCDEIRPGNKPWTEVRKPLEQALARELLDKLARLEERLTPVEFTGKWPHFKPGTRELVVP